MLAPVSAGPAGGGSFATLGGYITRTLPSYRGAAIPAGDVVYSAALYNSHESVTLQQAVNLMDATSMMSTRVERPVYHFQLTWQENEQPTQEQWKAAASHALEALGMADHEYVLAAHRDTDNFHVHAMVNRVHPVSFRAVSIHQDMPRLDKALREIEQQQGWAVDNGLYAWDDQTNAPIRLTPGQRELAREDQAPQSRAAGKLESYQDRESLERFVQGEPARDLATLIQSGSASWDDVHERLADHGLRLHKGEKGGYTVSALSGAVHVKASDVFRNTFAGKANRERLDRELGAWEEPLHIASPTVAPDSAAVVTPSKDVPEREHPLTGAARASQERKSPDEQARRTYNTDKRAQQAEARAEERAKLRKAFLSYRAEARAESRAITKKATAARSAIRDTLKNERERIRTASMSPKERKAARAVAIAHSTIALRSITTDAALRRAQAKSDPFEVWVEKRALTGNRAALTQVRGWRYQDARDRKRAQAVVDAQPDALHTSSAVEEKNDQWRRMVEVEQLRALQNQQLAQALAKTTTRVNIRSGDISYLLGGEVSVVDRGKNLSILNNDDAAIVLGLELSRAKYGRELKAQGSAEWQDKVARLAVRNRIDVVFTSSIMQKAAYEEQLRLKPAAHLAKRLADFSAFAQTAGDKAIQINNRESMAIVFTALRGVRPAQSESFLAYGDLQAEKDGAYTDRIGMIATITTTKNPSTGRLQYAVKPNPGQGQAFRDKLQEAAAVANQRAEHQKHHAPTRTWSVSPRELKREKPDLGR